MKNYYCADPLCLGRVENQGDMCDGCIECIEDFLEKYSGEELLDYQKEILRCKELNLRKGRY